MWNHECKTCHRKWVSLQRVESCQNIRCGGESTTRLRRSDAYRKPKNLSIDAPLALTRPRRYAADLSAQAITAIMTEVEKEGVEDPTSDVDDPAWAPPADFNPAMRLTDAGETNKLISRVGTGKLRCVSSPYFRIGERAARTNTNTVMGGSADDYAESIGQDPPVYMEWCHLVAACLGGPTSTANLVCGGYHANTHMLAIEGKLVGKTHLEVQVEAHCRENTVFAEKIVYRVRKPSSKVNITFEDTFDSLSEGFSSPDYASVRNKLGKWLRTYGKKPS